MSNLPVFFPMGAVTEKKEEKLEALWTDPNWVAERKYDGFRYRLQKENGKVSVLSRNPSVGTSIPVDKAGNVPHLVELMMNCPDGTAIDGEIITHENCESHEVTRIMGCDAPKAISRQEEEGYVKFVAYDLLFWKGKDATGLPYIKRRQALTEIIDNVIPRSPYIFSSMIVFDNKEQFYEEIVKGGGEGVILKRIHATYQISLDPKKIKKPKDTWVKVKKYDTYDCVIMGFTEPTKEYSGKELDTWQYWETPTGDLFYRENQLSTELKDKGFIPVTKPYYNGWCGAIKFGQHDKDTGILLEVGDTSGISDEIKQMLSLNPESFIGKVIEVGAMRQNKKSGALVHPRFLQFRDDKLPEQCILGEV
jgi:hypothetical protein